MNCLVYWKVNKGNDKCYNLFILNLQKPLIFFSVLPSHTLPCLPTRKFTTQNSVYREHAGQSFWLCLEIKDVYLLMGYSKMVSVTMIIDYHMVARNWKECKTKSIKRNTI
jgi:hypothetical protein